ncbi:39700_t:CDS:2 [Gigaspora margarita]|uniref:39700_t:CDS:1 n=1 Tax=Gigaspora margarita TaxID=4874 RepID=A0ABN7UV30_GIGMA|nr:39700_t:CDS:2 [Gigaspora margarita]
MDLVDLSFEPDELVQMWPSVKIINGRLCHPQFQGLVKCVNGILQQKLGKCKEDSGQNDWLFELHFVISTMNNMEELFSRNIRDEEEIPDTIDIQSVNCTEIDDLKDTMEMQDY